MISNRVTISLNFSQELLKRIDGLVQRRSERPTWPFAEKSIRVELLSPVDRDKYEKFLAAARAWEEWPRVGTRRSRSDVVMELLGKTLEVLPPPSVPLLSPSEPPASHKNPIEAMRAHAARQQKLRPK